ncbi:MAG: DUF1295 domain-containing protein [Clostridia bacterium]|nr:DUF1295 domain-containing protein [Clostridia bacterium]
MVFSPQLLASFCVALVISAIGFKSYVWFFSIGYGFAIAGEGLLMLLMFRGNAVTTLICLTFIAYGCRLGGFLAHREMKRPTYMQHVGGDIKDSRRVPIYVKVCIWLACAILYTLMVSPVFYRLYNGAGGGFWPWLGLIVMLCGVIVEAASDAQKSARKRVEPHRFVDTGLFRLVRCPNYLGELILWTGVLLSGIGGLRGVQWIMAILGYIGIVYVMFSGARRLELRQQRTYGDDPAYQSYVRTVPILLPFVPLYSVAKHKWLSA